MAVLLYDLPISHYCVKVRRILEHKGIAYEAEYAPYHDRQDLLAVSGQDYVPYLLWEDEGVSWSDIPDFLERKKPEPTIYPAGSRDLARILERWAHEVVEEAVWKYVVSDAPETFQDPRERWVFVELQERKRGPLELMAQRKLEFLKGVVSTLQPAEDRLAESPYLLGSGPSLADFALYGAVNPIPYTRNAFPPELPRVEE
ncbi:MAG TPA: glutathione S-transferase family protein, partial [Candidatus Thermoplasmatota archaeon]|nr:glutathione S-transferase family protein [Candidatus Thermoplasmatota archaeon]